jgi:hypothetical protein
MTLGYSHFIYNIEARLKCVSKTKSEFPLILSDLPPVTVAQRSEEWTVFARLEAGIVCSNPTQGMDV